MALAESFRSDPAVHAVQGDERIRTAARCLSTSYTYDHRSRDGMQRLALAGLLMTLAVLLPWLVAYVLVLGSCGRWSARQWGLA